MGYTLKEYCERVKNGELTPSVVLEGYLEKIDQDVTNSYLCKAGIYARESIKNLGESSDLCGAPIAVKDLISTQGVETTCGSKMLKGWVPPYSATCFHKLEKSGGVLLGKTNLDEFAMGGGNENSAFGPVKNPHDHTRVSGGSSGGSAVAVASDLCIAALGTDTGGSVRQPASFCGIVGVKPTYGRVSRYGVQAMASSLDQVGVMTQTVEDSKILLQAIAGKDENDATTQEQAGDFSGWDSALQMNDLKGKKIAVPNEYFEEGLDPEIKERCLEVIQYLESKGASVDRVDIPTIHYGVPIYYILMPAEASTNLARFDGVRLGLQKDTKEYTSIYEYYADTRAEGFGDEVKRRILTGTYVLSAGYYDAYYNKAVKARTKLKYELSKIYETYDAIVGPTAPTLPWKIGEKDDDPVSAYLEDIYTVIANLAGLPAMSVPVGTIERDGLELPVGFQIMSNYWKEDTLFGIGTIIEQKYQ